MIKVVVTKDQWEDDNIKMSSNYSMEANLEVDSAANVYDALRMEIEALRIAGYTNGSIRSAIKYFAEDNE